jgi:hypothetical protein
MDKKIEQKIVEQLKGRKYYDIPRIVVCLAGFGYEQMDVERVLALLKDRGEVVSVPNLPHCVRVTDAGLKANRPWYRKSMSYIGINIWTIIGTLLTGVGIGITIMSFVNKSRF